MYASEIDEAAAKVYELNWGIKPAGDIIPATESRRMDVPKHDVLTAGFPCQPFSKSGQQRGMDEARGTLFWNICRVLEKRKPSLVILENVRNIAGPRHTHEWKVIIRSLRDLGYQVSSTPAVFSPHLLPPERGGSPQVRDRVFIVGTYVGTRYSHVEVPPVVSRTVVDGWNPHDWDLGKHLPLQPEAEISDPWRYAMSDAEVEWVTAWAEFVDRLREDGIGKLPGFPVWADHFVREDLLRVPAGTPTWKANFLRKNAQLYTRHQETIDGWLDDWDGLAGFPPSRRKFEWQAQEAPDLWHTVMHFRPSGIRAKQPSYVPALVAITQTTVVAERRRRLTPVEGARLQGLPENFNFGGQTQAASYKQLGNGVSAGVVYHVARQAIRTSRSVLAKRVPNLVTAVDKAPSGIPYARDRYFGIS